MRSPLHLVGIVALGLWLIDNCDLEALARACTERGRWAFHLSVAPLRLVGVTGSPGQPARRVLDHASTEIVMRIETSLCS